jgi:hypothetical protein
MLTANNTHHPNTPEVTRINRASTITTKEDILLEDSLIFKQMDTQLLISSLKNRIQLNDIIVNNLQQENRQLITDLADTQTGTFAPPSYEHRWIEIKNRLKNVLRVLFKTVSKSPPVIDMTSYVISLRSHVAISGIIWHWELACPEETSFGRHCKLINLNNSFLFPCWSEENEGFVKYLSDQGYIKHYLLIDSNSIYTSATQSPQFPY